MRNYAAIARQYADDVIARRVPAGRWMLAAAARFLADLDRAAAGWDFYFDAEDAAHLCAFTESLPHIKGDLAKTAARLHLEPWQVFVLANLNGWRRVVGGGRRFRTAYIEVPRKNGKSTMIAPPLLFLLTADGEAGPEVYTAATKMAQSRIVFDVARAMVQKTPELRARAGLIVQKNKVIARGAGASFWRRQGYLAEVLTDPPVRVFGPGPGEFVSPDGCLWLGIGDLGFINSVSKQERVTGGV